MNIPAMMRRTMLLAMGKLGKLEVVAYDASAIVMLACLLLVRSPWGAGVPYVYGVASAVFLAMQYKGRYNGGNIVVRRLQRQQLLGAVCLVLASFAMWMGVNGVWPLRHNEWIVVVTIGAWMELYTAFRLPKEIEKEKNDKK